MSDNKLTKTEEPLNLNLTEPNEMESLAFPAENFKNQLLRDVQLTKEFS